MRSPVKTTVVVLCGAVALASAAYGIGSQTGGGTAAAGDGAARGDRSPRGFERGLDIGFGDLADELGVDADELRDALMDFHEQREGENRDAFAAALADALGKPVDEVEAALERVRPGEPFRRGCRPGLGLGRLAAALDVTRAELRQALEELRAGAESRFEERRDALVKFLAERFGLSEDEVERALPDFPVPPGPMHGPVPPGPPGFGG
jgi:ClpA/ClpB-like protein